MRPLHIKRSQVTGKQASPRAYTCPSKICYHLFITKNIHQERTMCWIHWTYSLLAIQKVLNLGMLQKQRMEKAISLPKEVSLPGTFFA